MLSKKADLFLVADVFLLKFPVISQSKCQEADIFYTRYPFFFFFLMMVFVALRVYLIVYFLSAVSTALQMLEASKNVL